MSLAKSSTTACRKHPLEGVPTRRHRRNSALTITTRGNKLRLAPDVSITSRCAGPLGADLAAVAPGAMVSPGAFTHPRLRVDLSGTRTFTVHGFTGTVTSTIIITGRRLRNQTTGAHRRPDTGTGFAL